MWSLPLALAMPGGTRPGGRTASGAPAMTNCLWRAERDWPQTVAADTACQPSSARLSGPARGQAGWRTCYRSFNGI